MSVLTSLPHGRPLDAMDSPFTSDGDQRTDYELRTALSPQASTCPIGVGIRHASDCRLS